MENGRALRAAEAMRRDEPGALGRLMGASHASLRDDFEVSSPELDAMVSCARLEDGCYGARMTGAGFGGCAMALVREGAAVNFSSRVAACYGESTGIDPNIYICTAANGADVVASPDG
jgi:galactokinase